MDEHIKELNFCIKMWQTQGGCSFGGGTKCNDCAAPYLLLKLINGEVLHGDMKRLTLQNWEEKLKELTDEIN